MLYNITHITSVSSQYLKHRNALLKGVYMEAGWPDFTGHPMKLDIAEIRFLVASYKSKFYSRSKKLNLGLLFIL